MNISKRGEMEQYRKSLCRVLRDCNNAGGSIILQWVVCMLSITEEMIDGKRKEIVLEYAEASYHRLRHFVAAKGMQHSGGFGTLHGDAYQLFK